MTHQRAFTVTPLWDDEASVWVSESDIIGLHIEADTLKAFEALVMDFAPEMIVENHWGAAALASVPLRDIVPIVRINAPGKLSEHEAA